MACRFTRSMMLFTVRVQWGETAEKRNDENGGYKHMRRTPASNTCMRRGEGDAGSQISANVRTAVFAPAAPKTARAGKGGNRKITC